MSTIRVGRVAGFAIRIHVSWAIIGTLIAVVAASQVGSIDPTVTPWARSGIGIAVAIAFLLSAVAHELAHAIVARQRGVAGGDVVVHFLGAAASSDLAATKPRDELAIALAGPLASLGIGAVLCIVAVVAGGLDVGPAIVVSHVALVVGTLDLALGALNLVPAYPLDGGRVVRALAWARTGDPRAGLATAATVGRTVGVMLAVIGVIAIVLLDPVDGLMIAFGGWFIASTARGLERRAVIDAVLDGVTARDLMITDIATIPPGLTIDTFALQVLDGSAAALLPVVQGGKLLGVIGVRQLRRLRPRRWASVRAEDLMVREPALPILGPDTTLKSIIDDLARTGLDGLPVVESGALTGLVTRRAAADAARARAEAAGITPW